MPETLDVGSNIIAGTTPENIVDCVRVMYKSNKFWDNPLGDGTAGKKIVNILEDGGL